MEMVPDCGSFSVYPPREPLIKYRAEALAFQPGLYFTPIYASSSPSDVAFMRS